MAVRARRLRAVATVVVAVASSAVLRPVTASAVTVEDGTDKVIGPADTRTVLDLIERNLKAPEAKVTVLRRSGSSSICGSVNVKNREGLYSGERGFVVDLADKSFGRVPDGPELLSSRSAGFDDKERIRQLYFRICLD